MTQDFKIVIPARLNSSRLPRKVLLDIAGKPLVQHVYERCLKVGASEVIVATDSDEVLNVVKTFTADVLMTNPQHASGTDRVAEVAAIRGWAPATPVVNVQGDAPMIPPESVRQVADLLLANPDAAIATLCVPIVSAAEYADPNVVKVVFDQHGRALYFSRASIPSNAREPEHLPTAWRHLGLYGYRVAALEELTQTAPCELELVERLEQLRAMWLGMEIRIAPAAVPNGPDVDTPEDLEQVRKLLA
jgi:3-deoxy-manno-octulosonate cytidylyltransferase (CMP-KDO synthetase)